MSSSVASVAHIIGYRRASSSREHALKFVLNWLNRHLPELSIIIVEQDSESLLDLTLPPNCTKHFIFNPGPYNRSWGFNVGASLTDKPILCFADADAFTTRLSYIEAARLCEDYQAVSLGQKHVFDVFDADPISLSFTQGAVREFLPFGSLLFFIQRSALDLIGGWNERFEGWGGEDKVITHLILNTLSNATLQREVYHVAHERSPLDGPSHPNYLSNRFRREELLTLSGPALTRHIELQRRESKGMLNKYSDAIPTESEQAPKFVLAITTYNRLNYLKTLLDSWNATRSQAATWSIICADDGSTDGTLSFLNGLSFDGIPLRVIKNNRVGVSAQNNSILDELQQLEFDVCFRCDDDIFFKKAGWDLLYWQTILRTGYQHLVFFDQSLAPDRTCASPQIRGQLCSSSCPGDIQGCFYTLTPEVVRSVGYFDSTQFGFMGLEHIDYTWRCCRAGYNVLSNPFDVLGSNDFIEAHKDGYTSSAPSHLRNSFKNALQLNQLWEVIHQDRVFIPRNLSEVPAKALCPPCHETANDALPLSASADFDLLPAVAGEPSYSVPVRTKTTILRHVTKERMTFALRKERYQRTSQQLSWRGGIHTVLGSIAKQLFNLCLALKLAPVVQVADAFASYLIRVGVDLKNIDNDATPGPHDNN